MARHASNHASRDAPLTKSPSRNNPMRSELDLWSRTEINGRGNTICLGDVEVLGGLESTGHERGWEGLACGVVLHDHVVVELAGVGDLLFHAGELVLEINEVLVGFEVWVGFCGCDEVGDSPCDLRLGFGSLFFSAVGVCGDGDRAAPGVGDGGEDVRFVSCVAFDAVD